MEKLTKEELESLQTLVNNYNNVKIKIADTEIAKDVLMKEIESLKTSYVVEEKKLSEKYGNDAVINIQTGEISKEKKE
jgi:hypothetical protein